MNNDATKMSGHTPTPWEFKRVKTSVGQYFKIGTLGQVNEDYGAIRIYDDFTSLNPRNRGNAQADAAFIVRCCNEWQALNLIAEAANNTIEAIHETLPGGRMAAYNATIPTLISTLAALAKLREEKR